MKIIKPFRHPDLCGAEEEEYSRAEEDDDGEDARDAGDAEFTEGIDDAAGGSGGIPVGITFSSLLFSSAAA